MLISFCAISLVLFLFSTYLGYLLFFKLVCLEVTRDKLASLFLSSLLGFLFIVCGYAMRTKGIHTIMSIPFGILLIGAFYSFSPKILPFSKELVFFIALFCAWSLYFNYVLLVSQDVLFYSLIAKSLSALPENYFLSNNLLSTSFKGTTPYHYGEMWATSLFLHFVTYNATQVMAYIVYPFLSFLCLIGMMASTPITLAYWKRLGYGTTLLFVTAIFYSLKPHFFIHALNLYLFNITSEVFFKLLFILPLSIAAAWWLKQRIFIAFLVLFQIPFFSFVTAPAIYGGSFLALILLAWSKKKSVKVSIRLFYLLAAHIIALSSFYALTPSPSSAGWTFYHLLDFYFSNPTFSLITFRNILIGQPLFILLSVLPCLGLFFLFKPFNNPLKVYHISLLLAGCITLCGIIAFAFLFPVRDSVQLAQVAWISVGFIFLLTILAAKSTIRSSYLIVVSSFTLVYLGFTVYSIGKYSTAYSPVFVDHLNNSLKGRTPLKIGSIRKESNLDSYFLYLEPILPFNDLPNFLGCIPMSRPKPLPTNALTRFRALDIGQESAFYEHLSKKNGEIWTIDSLKWEEAVCTYADSVQLDAVLVEQGAPVPYCLKQSTKLTLVTDSLSREQLFILN